MSNLSIREASRGDVSRLLEIYRPYVTDTTITFEYEVPSLKEFTSRIEKIQKLFFSGGTEFTMHSVGA